MKKDKFLAIGVAVAVALGSASAFAGGDAAVGAKLFKKKCKLCHTMKKGGKHKIGPNLFGVVGRKAGSTDFKKYQALKGASHTWDDGSIDKWLANPKKFAGKKTKMSAKIKKPADRANLIAYLHTLK